MKRRLIAPGQIDLPRYHEELQYTCYPKERTYILFGGQKYESKRDHLHFAGICVGSVVAACGGICRACGARQSRFTG